MKKFLFSETTPGVEIHEQKSSFCRDMCTVVDLMKKYSNYNIYWKTPVTGEEALLFTVAGGKITSVNPYYEIPRTFKDAWKKLDLLNKTELYKVYTAFPGADGPSTFYFDTADKAQKYLDSCDNGKIIKVKITSSAPLNYSDGCTLNELIYDFEIYAKETKIR